MKFSYYLEFYKRNIFTLDTDEDIKLLEENGKQAQRVEQYFCENILNIDELRSTIIQSYIFERKLDFRSRINYIRGITYSKSYINMNDVKLLSEYLQKTPTDHIYDSLFFEMGDSYDKLKFLELMCVDIIGVQTAEELNLVNELLTDMQNYLVLVGDNISCEEDETDEEKDIDCEDNLSSNKNNGSLIYNLIGIEQKLDFFKNYYENFKNIMLKKRGIDTNDKQDSYVIKGMDDWFNYIMNMLEFLNEMHQNIIKTKALDLSDFI